MKKIMFSERFGLGQAVLAGTKTQTRRIIKGDFEDIKAYHADGDWHFIADTSDGDSVEVKPAYEKGEIVAIAQAYQTLLWPALPGIDWKAITHEVTHSKGWSNKMFVKAEYMPYRIRITNIKAERLQDISKEDAMREGVFKYDKPPLHHEADMFAPWAPYVKPYKWDSDNLIYRCTARYAFAYLIDKISGGGTWNRNPWVFAYEFELTR